MFAKENSALLGFNKKKSVDVPLKKSVRKHLYRRALDYFQLLLPNEGEDVVEKEKEDEKLQALLKEVFLQGSLSSRTIHLESKQTMVLYVKTGSGDEEGSHHPLYPYSQSLQFVWMGLEEKNSIKDECPTVALWAVLANSLPPLLVLQHYTVQVPPAVSKYVCRGAHLMKAGMRSLPLPQPNSKHRMMMVAIAVQGNPQPFAVGRLLLASDETIGFDTKGVGVEIWNAYGDDLWKQCATRGNTTTSGNKNAIGGGAPFQNGDYGNVGFSQGKFVYPLHSDEEEDDISNGSEDESTYAQQEEEDEEEQLQPQEQSPEPNNTAMDHPKETLETAADPANEALNQDAEDDAALAPSPDEILHEAVCQALANLNNKDFPMLITTFYSKHVIPTAAASSSSSSSSGETSIDLKRTKYKKFGTYIKEQVATGLLVVGPDTKNKKNTDPGAMLVGYDKHHEDVHGLSKTALAMASSAANTKSKLVLINLYRIPSPVALLLKLNPDDVAAANATSEERRGTGMLTSPEVKKIVEAYITQENLVNQMRKDEIIMDGPLTDALFPPKQQKKMLEPTPAIMKRKEVMQQFIARLEPAYALVQMPGSKITSLQKGIPPKVTIEVSMRASRKFVTRVKGMEAYGIDGTVLSKDVSKRLACSATVDIEASAGRAALKKGCVELAFQGNIVEELEALLTGDESLSSHGGIKNSDYAIPLSVLDVVLRKNVPPKKKRGGGVRKK